MLGIKTSSPPQLFATQGCPESRGALCQEPPAPGAAEGTEGEPEGAGEQVRCLLPEPIWEALAQTNPVRCLQSRDLQDLKRTFFPKFLPKLNCTWVTKPSSAGDRPGGPWNTAGKSRTYPGNGAEGTKCQLLLSPGCGLACAIAAWSLRSWPERSSWNWKVHACRAYSISASSVSHTHRPGTPEPGQPTQSHRERRRKHGTLWFPDTWDEAPGDLCLFSHQFLGQGNPTLLTFLGEP